jgi:hypothetical protein
MTVAHGLPGRTGPRRLTRAAWWTLALFPVTFVGAMAAGEGLVSSLGYDVASEVPTSVVLLVGVPMVVLAISPLLVAAWLGDRARRHGDRAGRVPEIIGLALAAGFVLQNVVAALFG